VPKTDGRQLARGRISSDDITAAHLFDVLVQSLGRTPPVPSPELTEALDRVATRMMGRRAFVLTNEAISSINDLARSARKTAEDLRAQLEALEEANRQLLVPAERETALEPPPKPGRPVLKSIAAASAEVLRERINRIRVLRDRAGETAGEAVLGEQRNPIAAWADILATLDDDISEILKIATGKEIGLSPRGPRVRFVAQLIPLMSGQKASPVTVYEWLKGLRKKPASVPK
jgi:hypothetical protein